MQLKTSDISRQKWQLQAHTQKIRQSLLSSKFCIAVTWALEDKIGEKEWSEIGVGGRLRGVVDSQFWVVVHHHSPSLLEKLNPPLYMG